MKDEKPENPNAFPGMEIDFIESAIQGRTVYQGEQSGMTLRDYFAAKISVDVYDFSPEKAQDIMGSEIPSEPIDNIKWWAEFEAKYRFIKSDAMLKERSKE